LVCTPETSEQTVAACREVARRMSKQAVVLSEAAVASEAGTHSVTRTRAAAGQE
jgi:hypothetical protein